MIARNRKNEWSVDELSGSEAVFGFVAWLTTRDSELKLGLSNDCSPICDLIEMFCEANNLQKPRENWTDFLTRPKEKVKKEISMNFKEYQEEAAKTAIYHMCTVVDETDGGEDTTDADWIYPVMGLASEVGEVVGKLKKVIRDQSGVLTESNLKDLVKELGDVQWYLAETATKLGLNLQDIAEANIAKLQDRQKRGKLSGSGDNR